MARTDHSAFVDYAVLRPQLGLPAQELGGERALRITRAYLAAFLDRHLLGRHSAVEDFSRSPTTHATLIRGSPSSVTASAARWIGRRSGPPRSHVPASGKGKPPALTMEQVEANQLLYR
ncbi:hypothetical protein ABZT47_35705 [Sphaerisporangium sp. NPDC005289]|uniref:hypothetical protein n=1 Tax=Sphaerisporangium sp. NPDC005289 TaxID=3155247 RepID=UPI0033B30268